LTIAVSILSGKDRCVQVRVTAFLRNSLAEGAQDVLKLEAMARTEGLLGERQRITHAKAFKRAKHSLDIKSVRAGFGTNGGWRWELPCDRDGASAAASSIERQPVYAERRVPVAWVEGVAGLNYFRPPTDVPRHRWRQFVSDCHSFLNSSENWAERAAELGWDARALFGCHRNYPLMHLGSAGPPSQGWRTFLRNHAPDIAAMDLFVTPTIGFDVLYTFIIVRLARRDLVWINVTPHPTADWIARQITEAFPWNEVTIRSGPRG
jgi:hypothetical protein